MSPCASELNLDGLVGPTHNYAGLGVGNLASATHGGSTSNPRKAALEGLAKMRLLHELGVQQAVLPPQVRPDLAALRRLGFAGDDATVLNQARRHAPVLLAAACSASSMWAANAATVSPSPDTVDGRVHFTVANLISQPHRSIETNATGAALRAIFRADTCFTHHDPLPAALYLADEGAANHTRLCQTHGGPGIEVFVFGRIGLDRGGQRPRTLPARQTLEASRAVARLHGLDPARTVFAQQHPDAIDAGVFHNDVIAVGNRNVLLYHRSAFVDTRHVIETIRQRYRATCKQDLIGIEVTPDQLSVADAVHTYLFNSQLVSHGDDTMTLICPTECRTHPKTDRLLAEIVAGDNPIQNVRWVDVRQSMSNGGGPACLRLRVVLTESQFRQVHPGVLWTHALDHQLTTWVKRHHRDTLDPDDLADPQLLAESRAALDDLTQILGLGSLYGFQQHGGRAKRSQ